MQLLRQLLRQLILLFQPGIRAAAKGDWPDTVGPEPDEYPVVRVVDTLDLVAKINYGEFKTGWWSLAAAKKMHAGRIGRGIVPKTLIVHTTDMRPGTFGALVSNWTTQPGRGNGAHFLIGKSAADGVVQFCPIHLNANHAGGPNPGGFRLPGGSIVNPNVCSVGVELDNAGRLKKDAKGWYHPDSGYRFDAADVYVDEKGRGWEKVTEYQMVQLKLLWTALKMTLKPWPAGSAVAPNATYASQGASYAEAASPALIGHASTNPINKSDPGPQVMKEINTWN